jgi:hypothetical protein
LKVFPLTPPPSLSLSLSPLTSYFFAILAPGCAFKFSTLCSRLQENTFYRGEMREKFAPN